MYKLADQYPQQYKVMGQVADSQGQLHNVYEVQYPTKKGPAYGEKGGVCALCGYTGRMSEGIRIQGKWYCHKHGCAEEKLYDRRRNH